MRATVLYKTHDVGIEHVPDAAIVEPTDALVRVSRACICGQRSMAVKRSGTGGPRPAHGPRGDRDCGGRGVEWIGRPHRMQASKLTWHRSWRSRDGASFLTVGTRFAARHL